MTEYAIVYRSVRGDELVSSAGMRRRTTPLHDGRAAWFQEGVAALRAGLRTALRLAAGVTLAVGGLAITGGSFGLFAFIGIPMVAVGLGLITSEP